MKVGDLVKLKRGYGPQVGEIGLVVCCGFGNRAYASFPSAPEWCTYAKEALEIVSASR
tara:strand:+ start:1392 stop:1565 length:174 start_codon:yes stop_codon:yes gene_type:complete